MEDQVFAESVAAVPATDRSEFLRQVAMRTLGGLFLTAIVSVFSTLYIAPPVFRTGVWAVLVVVYGSFYGAQYLGRKMVYGDNKAAGFVVGTTLQGIALGFLLLIAMVTTAPGEGVALIGYALLMVVLSVAAMLLYVTAERREFSMVRAGLTMLSIPMLILMGLQLVLPMNGTAGVLVSGLFLAVSVGALLYRLNTVIHDFPITASTEASFELTLSIVVFFWNLLAFFLRMKRR
jgi:FtsH-binding integral membrane protein